MQHLKQIASILLVFTILGQTMVRTFWVLDYQWNRAIYLRYCENRNRPELHCNGKCYLEKRIAGQDEKAPKAPSLPDGFRQMNEVLLYVIPTDIHPPAALAECTERGDLPPFRMPRHSAGSGKVFHPPADVDV